MPCFFFVYTFQYKYGKKLLIYCASERNKYFLTLEERGGIFLYKLQKFTGCKRDPATSGYTNTVTALTSSETISRVNVS